MKDSLQGSFDLGPYEGLFKGSLNLGPYRGLFEGFVYPMKDSLRARLTWDPMKFSLKGSFGEGAFKYQKEIDLIVSVQKHI